MNSSEIKEKIDCLYAEIMTVSRMETEIVCEKYNVDKREEINQLLNEELEDLWNEYELQTEKEIREEREEKESAFFSYGYPHRQLLINL